MGRPSKEQRLADVHQEALELFNDIQAAVRGERDQCLQDRRFYSVPGAQWEGKWAEQFKERPQFEVNQVHLSVIRIINNYRNDRVSVDFVSKDGSKDDQLADVCDSLYRSDEQDSVAEEAYDNAFEEAVGGGIGAWRLRAEYEDELAPDDNRQRIRIEPIHDADSCVFFDLDARRHDKSDARHCFVLTPLTKKEFERRYGEDPATWPKPIDQSCFDWYTGSNVYVAEYYRVEERTDTVRIFRGIQDDEVRHGEDDFEEDLELERVLDATGYREVGQEKKKLRQVHKYLLSGGGVLSDEGIVAGREIPVVIAYGKRWVIDGTERCMGNVRLAKDSQRLLNMQLSRLGMIAAASAIEKPMFTPEQVAGHEMSWAQDATENFAYQLVNLVADPNGQQSIAGPVGMTKVPSIPPATATLLQLTQEYIRDILGRPQEGEKILSHVAGKTVEAVQEKIVDAQSFIYLDNMRKAVRRCGQIWLSMARDLYTSKGRKMKGLAPDRKTVSQIKLAVPMIGPDGAKIVANDLTRASFDVVADTGPMSVSKRRAVARAALEMLPLTQDPELVTILVSLALTNLDGEGLDEIRRFFRMKLVRSGVYSPTPDEAQMLQAEFQNKPQNANDAYLVAAAQEAMAKAQKASAEVKQTEAQTDETRAKTIKTLADVDQASRQAAIDAAQSLHSMEMDRAELDMSRQETMSQPPDGQV